MFILLYKSTRENMFSPHSLHVLLRAIARQVVQASTRHHFPEDLTSTREHNHISPYYQRLKSTRFVMDKSPPLSRFRTAFYEFCDSSFESILEFTQNLTTDPTPVSSIRNSHIHRPICARERCRCKSMHTLKEWLFGKWHSTAWARIGVDWID